MTLAAGRAASRWTVLAVATGAQATTSCHVQGLPVIAVALRAGFRLGPAGLALVLAAAPAGVACALLAWGRAADRFGERAVMSTGSAAGAAGLLGAAAVAPHGAAPVAACLFAAGAGGAGVNAAGGAAVLAAFADGRQGVAMAIRQTANPVGAAAAGLALPAVAAGGGLRAALLGLAALSAAAAAAGTVMPGRAAPARTRSGRAPVMTAAVRRVCAGSALLAFPQFVLLSCLVVFLHDGSRFGPASAARLLAVGELVGAAARVLLGHLCDRGVPHAACLRWVAAGGAALLGVLAAVLHNAASPAGTALAAGTVVVLFSWNGVAFAAAGAAAPPGRVATVLAAQNTALVVTGAIAPIAALQIGAEAGPGAAFAAAAVSSGLAAAVWRPDAAGRPRAGGGGGPYPRPRLHAVADSCGRRAVPGPVNGRPAWRAWLSPAAGGPARR